MAVLYASLDELKDRLGLTTADHDFALERCLEGASRWIEKETSRRFYTVSETRYYTAPAYSMWVSSPYLVTGWIGGSAQGIPIDDLVLPTPVVYPTLATDEDGDRVYERTWTHGTDFWLEPFNAPLNGRPYNRIERNGTTGRYLFPLIRGGISVTGLFGYSSTTPADIRELCLEVAGAGGIGVGPVGDLAIPGVKSYKIGTELQVTMADGFELNQRWQTTLAHYRTLVFA